MPILRVITVLLKESACSQSLMGREGNISMSELILLKVFLGSIVWENYVCSDSNIAVTKSCLGMNGAHMLLRYLIDSSYI